MDSINSQYEGAEEQIRAQLKANGYILLGSLLEQGLHDELTIDLRDEDWTPQRVLDMHRYESAELNERTEQALETIRTYLENVLRRDLQVRWTRLARYTAGSFTLQHDEQPPEGFLITLFFCGPWQQKSRGEHTYVPEEGDPLRVYPENGAVLVVDRHKTTNVFVKRLTHYARGENYIALQAVLR